MKRLIWILVVVLAVGATQYDDWRASRERTRQSQAQVEGEKAALAAIREASPDPMARLRKAGITLASSASHQGDTVRVDYVLTAAAPADMAYTFSRGHAPSARLIDPTKGQEIGRFTQGGNQVTPGQPVTGHAIFEQVTALPAGTQIQFPTLLVYLKPDQALRWEVQRPFVEGEVTLGHRFTVAGVEFEVERIRFTRRDAYIDYRQVTPPAQVGFHLLSFGLSDRMGGNWGEPYHLDQLPDPNRLSQRFEFVPALSRHWLIQVKYGVLALPGPTLPLEVK